MWQYFENFIKDKITINEHYINVTGWTLVHNFERTLPECLIKFWECFLLSYLHQISNNLLRTLSQNKIRILKSGCEALHLSHKKKGKATTPEKGWCLAVGMLGGPDEITWVVSVRNGSLLYWVLKDDIGMLYLEVLQGEIGQRYEVALKSIYSKQHDIILGLLSRSINLSV